MLLGRIAGATENETWCCTHDADSCIHEKCWTEDDALLEPRAECCALLHIPQVVAHLLVQLCLEILLHLHVWTCKWLHVRVLRVVIHP